MHFYTKQGLDFVLRHLHWKCIRKELLNGQYEQEEWLQQTNPVHLSIYYYYYYCFKTDSKQENMTLSFNTGLKLRSFLGGQVESLNQLRKNVLGKLSLDDYSQGALERVT